MPKTKQQDLRMRVLDRELKSEKGRTLKELIYAINRELVNNDYERVAAPNTVLSDIQTINRNHKEKVYIIKEREGRQIRYRYEDPEMSIYSMNFTDEQKSYLYQFVTFMSQIEGEGLPEWFRKFLENSKASFGIDPTAKPLVGFDQNKYYQGREYFSPLLKAVTNRQVLRIEYKSFYGDGPKIHIFHPYYIKEFNNRWFVLGRREGRDGYTVLAFDRIQKIENCEGVKFVPTDIEDFEEEYFDDIIGVTRLDAEPEDVVLEVSPELAPYITTKPLHPSQRVTTHEDGSLTVTIHVIPNFELRNLIVSHAENMVVTSPLDFAAIIYDRHNHAAAQYEQLLYSE